MKRKQIIPKVDDGIKSGDYESLKRFYARCNVDEFIHTVDKGRLLKFEFGALVASLLDKGQTVEENKTARALSYIEINKKSFYNNLNTIVRYINYFIEYFDPDKELVVAYYYSMWAINVATHKLSPMDFYEHLRSVYCTKSMISKIVAMIDHNIDQTEYKKVDKQYDESIQLTETHLKAIMGISIIHKFIIPIVSQYIRARHSEIVAEGIKDGKVLFDAFTIFLDIFDEVYDINLFNKVYHTATTRISKTKNDQLMWAHREKDNVSPTSLAADLIRDLIIDVSQKMVFNKSPIKYLHVCFDLSIANELKKKDKYEYSDMEMIGSDNVNESMSKWDTWQQNHTGHSEKIEYEAKAIIRDFLKTSKKELGLDIKKDSIRDEYEYYRDKVNNLDDIQINIIFLYFARRLGYYSVTEFITRKDLNWFIMIMKRELFAHNYLYLPYFITGKLNPVNTKKYNKKKLERMIMQHPSYEDYLDQYSAAYQILNKDRVFSIIKALISNQISIVDYDHQDREGKIMVNINENTAIDEFMRLYIDL